MSKRRRKKKGQPRLVVRKLGREHAWGIAYSDRNLIEIDPRLSGMSKLYVLIHERIHIMNPEKTEVEVEKESRAMAAFLHAHGARMIEQGETLLPADAA